MKSEPIAPSPIWFGVLLLMIGAFALGFGPRMKGQGLGLNNDPGPRAMPAALAICLIVGGVGYIAVGIRRGRPQALAVLEAREPTVAVWRRTPHRDALILLVALALYATVMPALGFALSTFLFSFGMMRRLRVSWSLAITVALALVMVIHLLFVTLFKVQLPEGIFALPF